MQPVNHYVPRFLLRNFCTGKKPRLWVFDKTNGSIFQAHLQKVGGERRFYEVELGEHRISLETPLALVEGRASKIIRQIAKAKHLIGLTSEDRATIALFVALQMIRLPHQRQHMLALDRSLQRSFAERGINPAQIENYRPLTPEAAKAVSVLALMQPQPLAEQILNKTWLVSETKASHPFYLSDNPVTLQNLGDRGRHRPDYRHLQETPKTQ